ncbi:C-type lectin domain family 2 member B-like [Aquarana catesbeiana]|uniref:C-type lectin domain family 2 member B-like n=1 Tax=Aquarana catesbeiana TaxID=8400 RepID=UPI003CC92832
MREITKEAELGLAITQDTAKPKPEVLQDLSRYGTKKHIGESLLYIILTFALINIVIIAALWTVYSVRGKCNVCPEVILEAPCEDDWIWYRKKCYYFSKKYDEWQNSQDFCVSHNASLALIDSQEELEFLQRFKGSSDHWIGLKREDNGGLWMWTNGSVFNDTFHIDGVSPCVFLNRERVSSAACYSDRYYICNKPDRKIERWRLAGGLVQFKEQLAKGQFSS